MTCSIFITRKDGTHNMSTYKKAFKNIKPSDENEYINMSIRPHSMILKFEICCKSFNYYLNILKSLLTNSDRAECQYLFEVLTSIMSKKDHDKKRFYFDTCTIGLDVSDFEMEDWIIYPINVSISKIQRFEKFISKGFKQVYSSFEDCGNAMVYFDYDDNKFIVLGNINDETSLDDFLINILLLYNSGGIIFNKSQLNDKYIIIKNNDNEFKIEFNSFS